MKKPNYFRYKHFDTAVIRTPLFPLDALQRPDDFLASKEFQEAIFIASPEMFRAKEVASKTKDKADKAENSLYKYFSRASTRCTPFGLFAGCSSVPIGDESTVTLSDIGKYRRCTRIDMQYICALIRKLENDPGIRPRLRFFPNDSIYSIAGQLRYVEYHYRNTRRVHQTSSVESSEYVELILESAKAGLTPVELARLLVDDDITIDEALDFINDMIDSQLLKSELDPAVVGADVLSVLIRKLRKFGDAEIVKQLLQIQQLLSDIDSQPIGASLPMYDEIAEIIKSIGIGYEEKFLFQTDMFKPVEGGGIDKNTVEELNDCLMFLSRINNTYQNNNLQKFKQDFAERYEQEEIRLTQVLDNELGLGYPSKNTNNDINTFVDDLFLPMRQSGENRVSASPIDLVLLKKYVQAIKDNQRVVIVEESDFPIYDHPGATYPDTCGVMCSIMRNKDHKPIIQLKSAGMAGAALLGRFCHIDKDMNVLVNETAEFEKKINEHLVIAEISHLPESRIGNIASRPAFRDVTIRYLSNVDETCDQVIDVSDLFLSIKNNRLHLRSQQLNKEIVPKLTCAHNYSMTPIPIYRFLCDMQTQDPQVGFYLQWGEIFKTFEYVPRIQYKNIVLARERWTISHDEIKDCYKLTDYELLSFFESFVRQRRLTKQIVIPEGDNEMYIDLTNIKSIKLMLTLVNKKQQFEVYEHLFSYQTSIVSSKNEQYYTNEIIVIFHK